MVAAYARTTGLCDDNYEDGIAFAKELIAKHQFDSGLVYDQPQAIYAYETAKRLAKEGERFEIVRTLLPAYDLKTAFGIAGALIDHYAPADEPAPAQPTRTVKEFGAAYDAAPLPLDDGDLWELWADAPETPICGEAPFPMDAQLKADIDAATYIEYSTITCAWRVTVNKFDLIYVRDTSETESGHSIAWRYIDQLTRNWRQDAVGTVIRHYKES